MSVEKQPIWNVKAGEPEQDPIFYDRTNTPRVVSEFNFVTLLKAHYKLMLMFQYLRVLIRPRAPAQNHTCTYTGLSTSRLQKP